MCMREIEIAGIKLSIYEMEDVCDSVTGHVLTGSWIWDSALILSEWMVTHGQLAFDFRGKTVVELGAGVGIPGLTAALLGATRVILTDLKPLLPGLQRNVDENKLREVVQVSELVWGSGELPSQYGEVDLVLMSDLFYDEAEMVALAETLKRICRDRQTTVWAASEVRPWTSGCLHELEREGFSIVELPAQLRSEFSPTDIRDSDAFAIFLLVPQPKKDNMALPGGEM